MNYYGVKIDRKTAIPNNSAAMVAMGLPIQCINGKYCFDTSKLLLKEDIDTLVKCITESNLAESEKVHLIQKLNEKFPIGKYWHVAFLFQVICIMNLSHSKGENKMAEIRDFYGRIIARVEEKPNGDRVIRDFYNRILGYYVASRDVTTDFYNRVISHGDCTGMLISNAKK